MAGVKGRSGGIRDGAGRKPKNDELQLIESLDRHIDPEKVFDTLHGLVSEGNIRAIQIYMNYRYGKPKETVSMTVQQETPIIDVE